MLSDKGEGSYLQLNIRLLPSCTWNALPWAHNAGEGMQKKIYKIFSSDVLSWRLFALFKPPYLSEPSEEMDSLQ